MRVSRCAFGFARRFAELVAMQQIRLPLSRATASRHRAVINRRSIKPPAFHIARAAHLADWRQQPHIVRLRFDMRVSTHYFQLASLAARVCRPERWRVVEHNSRRGAAIGHALSFCSLAGSKGHADRRSWPRFSMLSDLRAMLSRSHRAGGAPTLGVCAAWLPLLQWHVDG